MISLKRARSSLHTQCCRRSAAAPRVSPDLRIGDVATAPQLVHQAQEPRDASSGLHYGGLDCKKRGRTRVMHGEKSTAPRSCNSDHRGRKTQPRANVIVQQPRDDTDIVFKSLKPLVEGAETCTQLRLDDHTVQRSRAAIDHINDARETSRALVNDVRDRSRPSTDHGDATENENEPMITATGPAAAPTNIAELATLVEYEERNSGLAGLESVLKDLVEDGIGIPVTGPSAEKVWDAFLRVATTDASQYADAVRMRELLYGYAMIVKSETGQQYRHLHTQIVGYYLRSLPEKSSSYGFDAVQWHQRFLADEMARDGYIATLVEDVSQSVAPLEALEQWKTMYLQGSLRRLYSRCMAQLQPGTILYKRMKEFLLAAGDRPSSAAADYAIEVGPAGLASIALSQISTSQSVTTMPARQPDGTKHQMPVTSPFSLRLPTNTADKALQTSAATNMHSCSPPRRDSDAYEQHNLDATARDAPRQAYSRTTTDPTSLAFTRSDMSLALGAVHGISEKHLGDQFCARVFATKLFPFSMSLISLRLLGVKHIGSLSICEIAQRSHRPEDLLNKLKQVKDEGIMLRDSVFLRLLQHVAEQNDHKGYHALLQSDQHPDNYDDPKLQTALLYEYEKSQQWMLVQLSLQALSFSGVRTKTKTWNAILRKKLAENDMRAVRQCYRSMYLHDVPLSIHTLRCIRDLLPLRKAGQRESHIKEAGLKRDFVASAYMRAIEVGHPLSVSAWRELLKRYGMAGDIDKLGRCIIWLAQLGCREATMLSNRPINTFQSSEDIPSLLDAAMQKAVIWWAWRAGVERQPFRSWSSDIAEDSFDYHTRGLVVDAPSQSWARGIALLRDLKNVGVKVEEAAVRKAIRQQLWTIFGPGHSTRKRNDVVALRNTLTLAEYIKYIHNIWPGLYTIDEKLMTGEADTHTALLLQVFGSRQSVSRKDRRYVQIRRWALTQHPRSMTQERRNTLNFRQAMRTSASSSYWVGRRAKLSIKQFPSITR